MIGKVVIGVTGVAVAGVTVIPYWLMRRYFSNPFDIADRIGRETIEYFSTEYVEQVLGFTRD